MIPPKSLSAIFLLSRVWPIQQVKSGKASEIISVCLQGLNAEELKAVKEYELTGRMES